MMNHFDRRAFLGLTSFAVGAAMRSLATGASRRAASGLVAPLGAGGYGQLRSVKARNTGETALALPEGFEYTIIGRTGAQMSDGHLTPAAHDGMAAFNINGQLRLVRNHEINPGLGQAGAAFGDQARAYDRSGGRRHHDVDR